MIEMLVFPMLFSTSVLADNRVIEPLTSDINQNKIIDRLENKLETTTDNTLSRDLNQLDVIINLNHTPNKNDISSVESLGGTVHQTWDDLVFAMHASLPIGSIENYIQTNEDVVLIQENSLVNVTLEYSSRQIHARPMVWENKNNVYPQGYTGDPDHSIAIIDTGIDDSHPDIAGRIIAWKDVIGEYPDNSTADIYPTPTDRYGHGSHCAGIALGDGSAGTIQLLPGKLPISFANYFYPIEGWGWYNYYPVDTTGGASFINATLYWEINVSGDEYYIWFGNDTGVGIGWKQSANEPIEAATDLAVPTGIQSNYRVLFGTVDNEGTGDVDTNGTNYCGQVRTPMNSLGDSHNLCTGIAPTCSLVGVKSLSDYGPGYTADIINGMEWVFENRTTYNIRAASLSLGGAPGEYNPSEITTVNNLVDHGVVVVSSAGNDQPAYVSSPALANKSIAVGSVNQYNEVSYYSSLGDPGNSYIKPDVVAPGGSYKSHDLITSIDSNDADHVYKSYSEQYFLDEQFIDDYQVMQGTSMACPHVAGIVGLMTDAFDSWDYYSSNYSLLTKMIICMTASETNRPGEDATPPLNRGGKDRVEGYGIVCADAAIEAITCEHLIGSIETETLGDDPLDKKVWARQMDLFQNEDTYYFELTVPSYADYDLYIYNKDYKQHGDPIILSKSTTDTLGGVETIEFLPTYDGLHYLVVKWVEGSGSFTLNSYLNPPDVERASVPVFSSISVIVLVIMLSLIALVEIKKKKDG